MNDTEEKTRFEVGLRKLWQELLVVNEISNSDDWFAIGGKSLLAIRLVDRIHRDLGVSVDLDYFLRNPTISSLLEEYERIGQKAQL